MGLTHLYGSINESSAIVIGPVSRRICSLGALQYTSSHAHLFRHNFQGVGYVVLYQVNRDCPGSM